EVLHNIEALRALGGEGPFGFYEAIDFTLSRQAPQPARDGLTPAQRGLVVKSYMAHHQGMAFVALANLLTGDRMPRRLHAEARVRSADLLLEERLPLDASPLEPNTGEEVSGRALPEAGYPVSRRITSPDTPAPRTHLLSNGRFTTLLTNAGGGFSTCRGLDVTRFRADRALDCWGTFIYVRDLQTGRYWSAAHQPTCARAELYEVVYSIDKAEFRRLDDGIETVLEVCVSPERDVEVRRVTLHNVGSKPRELELTSYVEVVLSSHAADVAHPAFAK